MVGREIKLPQKQKKKETKGGWPSKWRASVSLMLPPPTTAATESLQNKSRPHRQPLVPSSVSLPSLPPGQRQGLFLLAGRGRGLIL